MSDASRFDPLMGSLDYPMFIVTTVAGGERSGCLVGFATQVSIDPPRFLVALSEKNHTFGVAEKAERLAIHVVPAGATDLAELFGGETGDGTDKFDHCAWHAGPHDLPILDDCQNWFTGRIAERVHFGDHTGHVLEPEEVRFGSEGTELTLHRAKRIEPGHAP